MYAGLTVLGVPVLLLLLFFSESHSVNLSSECMFLGSLSRHNEDLERRTLKPSARHSSGSWTYRATALRQISVTAPFYLEDSRSTRARVHACGRESPRESALAPPFICFFSSTWAGPMQIGLSQECCLFCLKSSLLSLDLPLTFLVF